MPIGEHCENPPGTFHSGSIHAGCSRSVGWSVILFTGWVKWQHPPLSPRAYDNRVNIYFIVYLKVRIICVLRQQLKLAVFACLISLCLGFCSVAVGLILNWKCLSCYHTCRYQFRQGTRVRAPGRTVKASSSQTFSSIYLLIKMIFQIPPDLDININLGQNSLNYTSFGLN